ncbi:MAG: endonuclease/exonuclease/phosphatase family protein [Pseudomonadota bacterium]
MLRDLRAERDEQTEAALDVIAALDADILLLLDVDWDHGGLGLQALLDRLSDHGCDYAHTVALKPVTGLPSGYDLDGNGALGEARDALGYGRFTGDSGLVLLSRYPLGPVTDLSTELWADHGPDAADLLPEGAERIVPLTTTAQWVIPLQIGSQTMTLITLAAGTPVYDGPEDRNGIRNRDELQRVAALAADWQTPIVLGRANVDPMDGEGLQEGIGALLAHPVLRDPAPRGYGGDGAGHRGDPALDTVDWQGPGPLRVDYVLPAQSLEVTAAGVLWPGPDHPLFETLEVAGPGRPVWVDIALP